MTGKSDAGPLSLKDAAERLGVSPARINQLLSAGELEGPPHGPGRAPKGAGRVWSWSLADYQARRSRRSGSAHPTTSSDDLSRIAALEEIVSQLQRQLSSGLNPDADARRREGAARAAAYELKVAADAAIDDLNRERERAAALEAEVAALRHRVAALEAEASTNERARAAYSEALTQLLAAQDPADT